MAMVIRQQLPKEDLEGISAFMSPDYDGPIPDLSDRGAAVLEIITGPRMPLRHVVVGRFVTSNATQENDIRTTDGNKAVSHSDIMYDEYGSTGEAGIVIEDFTAPEDAFLIGVPF